ncbi:MAG TPA: hypothetical protein VGN20_20035 [Mucilaginibacter sp.]|jgi:hypothetical protein
MKTFILAIIIICFTFKGFANEYSTFSDFKQPAGVTVQADTVKLQIDGNTAYYQFTVKVDSNLAEPIIYIRALQFMASKNIQQTYGYQEEGKLIFSTMQDLNVSRVYVGDDNEAVEPYSVQFAITLDIKTGRYRYTISNILFFLPTETGNKRETLSDVYLKATNTDSRRIAKNARNLIASFERYITTLTNELYEGVEQKSAMNKSKF